MNDSRAGAATKHTAALCFPPSSAMSGALTVIPIYASLCNPHTNVYLRKEIEWVLKLSWKQWRTLSLLSGVLKMLLKNDSSFAQGE